MENKDTQLNGKRILIFQQRNWAKSIGHFLAEQLHAQGCQLAAWTMKPTTHQFIIEQKTVPYQLVINDDEVLNDPEKFITSSTPSLTEICRELGVDSVWPFVSTIRNYVKSYGQKYYYSFNKNVSDEQMVAYVRAVYGYLKRFFDEFKPDVILAPNFVVLPHIFCNLMAQKRGIPMIAVTDSKIQGQFIFTYGYQDDRGPFFDRFKQLQGGARSENQQRAAKYIEEFCWQFKQPDHAIKEHLESFYKKILHELAPYYHSFRWILSRPKNYLPSLGPTIDYRPPRVLLRDHYRQKQYRRFAQRFRYADFKSVSRYVYFPLQFQPEASIDVVAPFFNNQIETARQVAMSLPDDYTLVVKEHPAMVGLRTPGFLKKIVGLPNVKLIDYRISSHDALRHAAAVVSPGATTVAEAAILKIPAIQLGDLGITAQLPNVIVHREMPTLSAAIKKALAIEFDQHYEQQLENFVAAVYDTGFDFRYTTVWAKGKGDDYGELWRLYRQEIIHALQK